ncbi:DUF2784 family protein [Patescibacteria group bacterium]
MKKRFEFWASVVMVVHWLAILPIVTPILLSVLLPALGLEAKWVMASIAVMAVYLAVILVLQRFYGGYCPLSVLEDRLRARADSNYTPHESFISYRLKRHLNIDVPPEMVTTVTIVLTVLSGLTLVVTAIVSLA